MFPGSEQEEETDNAVISRSVKQQILSTVLGSLRCVLDELDRDGFDTIRRRILFGISSQKGLYAPSDIATCIQSWVLGPQAGDLLADGAHVVLHRARSERVAAGGDSSVA